MPGLTMDYSIPPRASRKSPWPGGAELPKYSCDSYDPFASLAAAEAHRV